MSDTTESSPTALPRDDGRTEWLMGYQSWLRILAEMELGQRLRQKMAPSDVVQHTLLEAWRGWDGFRGTTEAERVAWLRGILANQLALVLRRYHHTQQRDVRREQSLDASLAQSSKRLQSLLADPGGTPSRELILNEQRRELLEVLDRLPPDYRQVIIDRNLHEMSFDEIAGRMQRHPGAVRMLWVRALAKLRSTMEP
jgi:RNA polymerase sigma-70 factor (ECF subfamily)